MGYKKRWNKAKSIYEALGDSLDDELKPFVQNYQINLFEIAYLEEEDVKLFKSDFRFVVDYLVQMRKNNDYVPMPGQIEHIREVMNAMAALTDDKRFEEVYIEAEKGDEPKTMSDVLDRVEKRGELKGQRETAKLMNFLWSNGRGDDAMKASNDEGFLKKLLKEFEKGLLVAE